MSDAIAPAPLLPPPMQKLARHTLAAFVLVFALSRIVVLLIMTRRMPDFFLFVGQTHVHHLNYGIFLLVTVAGWAIFSPPQSLGARNWAARIYGVGLALTFDEFGMWLNLDLEYWQRASYDAVVVVAAVLTLLAVAPSFRHWRWRQWTIAGLIVFICCVGMKLMGDQLKVWTPILQQLEKIGPRV